MSDLRRRRLLGDFRAFFTFFSKSPRISSLLDLAEAVEKKSTWVSQEACREGADIALPEFFEVAGGLSGLVLDEEKVSQPDHISELSGSTEGIDLEICSGSAGSRLSSASIHSRLGRSRTSQGSGLQRRQSSEIEVSGAGKRGAVVRLDEEQAPRPSQNNCRKEYRRIASMTPR